GLGQFAVARNGREREALSTGRGDQPLKRSHRASTTSHYQRSPWSGPPSRSTPQHSHRSEPPTSMPT
ncbi:hypothetical protein, partial [Lacticaseibacillus pantheris]